MKINLNESLLEKYFSAYEYSKFADEIINTGYQALSPEEGADVLSLYHHGMSLSDAFESVLVSEMNDDRQAAFNDMIDVRGSEKPVLLDPKQFTANPYYQKLMEVKDLKAENNRLDYHQNTIHAGVCVAIDEKKIEPENFYRDDSPIGCFEEDFTYPALLQDGRVWMSFAPHETITSAEALDHAHGRVLTFGLGLGYFAFMASQKEDVSSVTIVEFDPEIIDVFQKHFLPLFPHPEKIEIMQGDAVAFSRNVKEPYDDLFADIWHDAEDGLPFWLQFIKDEHCAKHVDYWIERDILTWFRRHVLTLLEEEANGSTDEDYAPTPEDTFSDRLLTTLHFALKDTVLSRQEDMDALLSEAGLRKLAESLPEIH
jgi:hypothetical protein